MLLKCLFFLPLLGFLGTYSRVQPFIMLLPAVCRLLAAQNQGWLLLATWRRWSVPGMLFNPGSCHQCGRQLWGDSMGGWKYGPGGSWICCGRLKYQSRNFDHLKTLHPNASPIDFHRKLRAASVVFAPLLTASGQGIGSLIHFWGSPCPPFLSTESG